MSLSGRPHFPVFAPRILLAALLACGGLLDVGRAAESTPAVREAVLSLELGTDRKYYLEGASSQVLLSARIHATAPVAVIPAAAGVVIEPTSPGSGLSSPNGVGESAARAASAEATPASKAGRNIAFVLDRSGSMAGERIEAARRAIAAAVAALDPHDVVSVVAFGSELETLVEAQPRAALRELEASLAAIEPVGGAALYDALNQGAAQLRRHAAARMASHLILITDGPATKGPREPADFAKLVGLFTGEGITLTSIGLGDEFEEDTLATLARIGHGRFVSLAEPARLAETLAAEVAELGGLVARDVVLTVDFAWNCEAAESHGWWKGDCEPRQVVYRLPYLTAARGAEAFTTTRIISNGWVRPLATVKLQWIDPLDGAKHEFKREVTIRFDPDTRAVRTSGSAVVLLDALDLTVSHGLQEAIEQFDKKDPRRALRALRRARDEAKDLNFELENEALAARIRILDTHLESLANRPLTPLDRKAWRAGLGHEFPVAVKVEEAE